MHQICVRMKSIRKIFVFLAACLMAGTMALMAANREHVVRPGDTLYSLAKFYGVTVEAIQAANPSIEGETIKTGMSLVIPESTQQAGDKSASSSSSPLTFSNGGNSQKDDTKKGSVFSNLFGKNKTTGAATQQVSAPQVTFDKKPTLPTYNVLGTGHWTDGTLTVAVILPFNLNAKSEADQKTQMRSVEFYEGVLMAVDEIQQTGRRVSVLAYDLGTEPIQSILNNQNLLSADFIIAPMDEADLKPVADWGEEHGTPVVSPFVFNAKLIDQYEHLFQINTQKSMLYPQLTEDLLKRFRDYTFVFLTDSVSNSKQDPYPLLLKKELKTLGVSYKELSYYRPERLMACDSILGIMDKNILFVPTTPQQESMRRMFSGLQHVKILREARYQEALNNGVAKAAPPKLAVFGYPEWVLYTNDFIDYFYDLNVYMFSKIYISPFDPFVKRFYDNFKAWYNKDLMALMPKYGVLGYDLTRFFMRALGRHGQHLEERIAGQEEENLQTVICFERGEEGKRGFYNHALYLVHFTPESTIEKIIIK